MGWKPPCADYDGHTVTQRAGQTYPHSQTESAEEAGVLTPKRLHFLLIIVRAAGEGRRANRTDFKDLDKHQAQHLLISLGNYSLQTKEAVSMFAVLLHLSYCFL